MSLYIIDGKRIANDIKKELKDNVSKLKNEGIVPGLATILVGDDPASQIYVSSKVKSCQELGINSYHHKLESSATKKEIIDIINKLNTDSRVHGILLQLPLPKGIESDQCLEVISPKKDVDGLHPYNLGCLFATKSWQEIEKNKLILPCTPSGIMFLLKRSGVDIEGKNVVVVGRSNLVGKPIAMILLAHNATVTMAHSKTKNLQNICSQADILIAAIGKPGFITKEFVKQGASVVDVGTNRTQNGIKGDVDFESVKDIAGYITPVPGGVGPMTITMLMRNTILASMKNN